MTYDGVGPHWGSAANSYIWTFLIPEKKWFEIEKISQLLVKEDIWNQSTNVLSNLGLARMLQGKWREAEDAFSQALDRPDKFSEAEASWGLSKVYLELGLESSAAEYARRCEAAGGYDEPDFFKAAKENTAIASSNASIIDARPNFCGGCGSKFMTQEQNFCANCGSSRG
jgi:tetratricopeptide (TPR) repeat protein